MDRKLTERIGAATGIGFVILSVVAFIVVKQPPKIDAPLTDQVAYFATHRAALLWQVYLFGAAMAMFLWFAGSLRSALWKAEGDTGRLSTTAHGGAIAAAAIFLGGVGLLAALAYNLAAFPNAAAGAGATLTLFSVANVAFTVGWFPTAIFVGASSIVIIRHNALPTSIGVFGIPVALAMLAAGGTYRATGAASPGGTLSTMLFLVFQAWVLAASVALVARIGTKDEPRTIYLDQPQRERLSAEEMHGTSMR